jgi:hypothetical protein
VSIERIRFRRGTAAAWTTANPVLATGEPGFETDTGKLKTGDGTTVWTSLPYVAGDADLSDLATVATSGAYSDLTGTPEIPETAADVGAAPISELVVLPAGTPTVGQALVVATVDPLTFAWGTAGTPDPDPDPDPDPTAFVADWSTYPDGVVGAPFVGVEGPGAGGNSTVTGGLLSTARAGGQKAWLTYDTDVPGCTGTILAHGPDEWSSPCWRFLDASNYWFVEGNSIGRVIAGVTTFYAANVSVSGETETIVTIGADDLITVYLDGQVGWSATDSTHDTATKVGVVSGDLFSFTPAE